MSTVTSILSTDIVSASRSTINTNFDNLNSTKVETTNAFLGVSGAYMPNFAYKNVFASCISGHNDLYTCPPGKKAAFLGYSIYNANVSSSVNFFPEVQINSSYYRTASTVSATAGGLNSSPNIPSFLMTSGMKASMNTSSSLMNCWVRIAEFDSSSPLTGAYVTSVVSGNNTLYTCPSGKTAAVAGTSFSTMDSTGLLQYINSSGSPRINTWYVVPNGQSASLNNQVTSSVAVVDGDRRASSSNAVLASGDSIVLNVDTNTATQFAYLNVLEVNA